MASIDEDEITLSMPARELEAARHSFMLFDDCRLRPPTKDLTLDFIRAVFRIQCVDTRSSRGISRREKRSAAITRAYLKDEQWRNVAHNGRVDQAIQEIAGAKICIPIAQVQHEVMAWDKKLV
jgi:hypothetical protein